MADGLRLKRPAPDAGLESRGPIAQWLEQATHNRFVADIYQPENKPLTKFENFAWPILGQFLGSRSANFGDSYARVLPTMLLLALIQIPLDFDSRNDDAAKTR